MSAWGIARLVAVAAVALITDRARPLDACDRAWSAARDRAGWDAVRRACDGATDTQRVRRLWALERVDQGWAVMLEAPRLLGTRAANDAIYVAGRVMARRGDDALLWTALVRHALAGERVGVNRASADLVRVATDRDRFELAVALAELTAATAGTDALRYNAELALARFHDAVGHDTAATDALLDALAHARRPSERAFVYLQYGMVLLDRYTPAATAEALVFLERARALGVPELADAIALNRAVALAELGRDDEAAAAVAAAGAAASDGEPTYDFVRGLVAAHRDDRAEAEQLLEAALAADLPSDYAVAALIELAALDHRAGREDEAERALVRATEVVEAQRAEGAVELRPWILAHRARPYRALLAMRTAAGRSADALAVLESLHARAWRELDGAPARPLDAAALIALAGDRELLLFAALGDEVWRAYLHGGAIEVTALAGGAAAVEALAAAPDDPTAAERAGQVLLPAGLVASERPLYLVADGALSALPWPALRRGGRALIEVRAIARLPGLAALACRNRPGPDDGAVVIGDPDGDLPAAADEARAAGAALGVTARLRADATVAAVRSARAAAELHLAVHGALDDRGGALVLADGVLTADAIRAERLAPREVVLAGCSTGASRDAEGWGALSSAFLAAGSSAVIATTRTVDDRAAATIMRAYRAQPPGPAVQRLAAAQRALASSLPPSAWASFAAWSVIDCP